MHILLVDDDPVFSDIIIARLAKRGQTEVTRAESAKHALDLIDSRSRPFDCYLLDVMMEDMNGIELCHLLRQRADCKTAPMIMLTASQEAPLMDQAFKAGATDFLRKPLSEVELAGRITMAMLLVETTRNEKTSRDALQALLSSAPIPRTLAVDERLCFSDVNGMMDYYEMENHLLRLKDGFYQISVFRIRVPGFEKRTKQAQRSSMLRQLHIISEQISGAVATKRLLLTYVGRGRFICCIVGRQSRISTPFQNRLQNTDCEALKDPGVKSGEDNSIVVTALSDHHILTKATAIDLVRNEFDLVASLNAASLPNVDVIEDSIFDRTDKLVGAAT
ncbi:response regulator [Rhodobacteraceae bacterium KMM 6894]|nr:response regulator [Rhodobacteraceae bacterium KMM 6894]